MRARAEALNDRAQDSDDVSEVRAIGETLQALAADIADAEAQLAAIDGAAAGEGEGEGEGEGGAAGEASRSLPLMSAYRGAGAQLGASDTVGAHFTRALGGARRSGRFSVAAPEYRAAGDPVATGGVSGPLAALLTEADPNITHGLRRATIADLFSWGATSAAALTFYAEGAREGDFGAVAEGAAKAQVSYAPPTATTVALSKIAAFVKVTDEMLDDLPFVESEINGRLLYDLSIKEEQQLLTGNGTAPNVRGILSTSGIQTTTSASEDEDADAILHAISLITNATGLRADAIAINPADYELLRKGKDANGQYYGGGYFAGAYNNGDVVYDLPLWGLPTVTSPAVPNGSAIVGAFKQGATPYRKGGITVEATNSDKDDFERNLVTIRAEERILLAVRNPMAFCKVNFA
jgi:HK97 family phage major capsid protein